MYFLFDNLYFPPVSEADQEGILAVGGDLSPERLKLAYERGIFPWFNEGEPILWWAPDPRMVLFLDELVVSKSMRNVLNRKLFAITFNKSFREVILNCQNIQRDGQDGTWISDEIVASYCELNKQGLAKSVEVWQDGILVGGLYGMDLGHVFCGESMFSKVSNASKAAFIALVQRLREENYKLLDCQVYNPHLDSLGCREIDREDFMSILMNK
ncbi:leucyl/phenylalanyl-tRNA--protein transferase [Flavobacterium hungaricum]|uniref:Leucyl/phenylalanyl-tRNA--protein transferase n=1 Tax=Flavobacterium hungaricum TaxID=2082725 RepID=A0ABR9TLG6_9FLAO|nr:leucyl/phenylalanyl-tRNA--protein transferase [Flavobacterium hungaricum]MBE8725467.1 leucyl/phenylalanyl-tRNA--protein transferase [Flavobacterium hungaricum]